MKPKKIRLVSWNVNGMNAVMKKNFKESLAKLDADIVALQETKLQEIKLTPEMEEMEGYTSYWAFSTVKKGYSGVAVYSRVEPKVVRYGIGKPVYDNEGRIIEMDFGDFVLFNVYFPNGQMNDERLRYKMDFYTDFFTYAEEYKKIGKAVIVAGDYNTAHHEIDLKNPKANEKRSGFLKIEREALDKILQGGYVDSFRHFHPDAVRYSWWSYRFRARERNAGWRIDYFFVTRNMIENGWIDSAYIDNEIYGSDHCPVGLEVNISKARSYG